MKRVVKAVLAALAIPATVLALANPASAVDGGKVQWKHAKSGYCLSSIENYGPVSVFWNCKSANGVWWTEIQNSDGSWNMVDQWGWCLTNYNDTVYVEPCSSGRDQTNWYQRWYETNTATGWKLTNRQTGRVLDSNGSKVYTGPDYGDSDTYQRWH
ncbi:hypothetical protein [Streptomyces sp. NPDC048332]|uniref:RICIN domain-containing protein n=1 Tax=Streptomyces sp. NPDC048332 TaxID=3154619 RepID=UPI0034242498